MRRAVARVAGAALVIIACAACVACGRSAVEGQPAPAVTGTAASAVAGPAATRIKIMATEVGSAYGDPDARLVRYVSTQSTTLQPMYIIFIDGQFRRGALAANHIEFSALADGSEIWAIRGFTDTNPDVWVDASV